MPVGYQICIRSTGDTYLLLDNDGLNSVSTVQDLLDNSVLIGINGTKTPSHNFTVAEIAKIVASDGAADDYFGYTVAVSDTKIVVSAYGDDDSGSDSGSAYVYE